jgi:F0F1-type ATP synthase assembly protein I
MIKKWLMDEYAGGNAEWVVLVAFLLGIMAGMLGCLGIVFLGR